VAKPVILAVDEDDARCDVERELVDRYDRHYDVLCLDSWTDARSHIEELAATGVDVALFLVDQSGASPEGVHLLAEVHRLHPHVRRALLIDWAGWGEKVTGSTIFEGIAHGHFDHYVVRPSSSPDELFHMAISGMLLDWAESRRAAPYTVHIVGEDWSGRAYELREVLQQCALPHSFWLADSEEGRAHLAAAGGDPELPLVVFPNGTVLMNPTNAQISLAAGGPIDAAATEYDVVIVGAGPAGLSAAVYGASEGLRTVVIDRGGVGGQATSSSLIRNYLGFPRGVTGRRLAEAAYDQAWVFGSDFVFMQTVTAIERDGDQLLVTLSEGGHVRTRAVLLATGASYRRIGVPSLEALTNAGVFYGGPTTEAAGLTGADVFIVGGANSAGQAAVHLARYARRVTLVVRAESLRAGMSEYLVRQVEATDNIEVRTRAEVVGGGGHGHLQEVVLHDRAADAEETLPANALFLLIGARPNTDWLPPSIERDDRGFLLTGLDISDEAWPLDRRPFLLETSMPGVFAAGDVRHGGGRRVASAVGEGSIAIQLLHQLFTVEPRRALAD
jgi:thioredoxin reductase (NADPH)